MREVTEEDVYTGANMAKNGWKMPDEDKKNMLIKSLIPIQRNTL